MSRAVSEELDPQGMVRARVVDVEEDAPHDQVSNTSIRVHTLLDPSECTLQVDSKCVRDHEVAGPRKVAKAGSRYSRSAPGCTLNWLPNLMMGWVYGISAWLDLLVGCP